MNLQLDISHVDTNVQKRLNYTEQGQEGATETTVTSECPEGEAQEKYFKQLFLLCIIY